MRWFAALVVGCVIYTEGHHDEGVRVVRQFSEQQVQSESKCNRVLWRSDLGGNALSIVRFGSG